MANTQNQEAKSYSDKFIKSDMQPTVRGFGGRPLEGFLVVGTTGLAQAFVMGGTKGKVTNTEILGGIRLAYRFIDLAWTKGTNNLTELFHIFHQSYYYQILSADGDIVAIACTGIPLDPILYCKLIIQKDDGVEFSCLLDEYRLRSEALTGLFPRHQTRNFQMFSTNSISVN